jgi:DNA-binding XRE family transcriptional regulator
MSYAIINNLKPKNNETKRICIAAEPAQSDDEKNMSDAELGRQIGVTRQTVNNWINGRRDISLSYLYKVANALEIRIRDLFTE